MTPEDVWVAHKVTRAGRVLTFKTAFASVDQEKNSRRSTAGVSCGGSLGPGYCLELFTLGVPCYIQLVVALLMTKYRTLRATLSRTEDGTPSAGEQIEGSQVSAGPFT